MKKYFVLIFATGLLGLAACTQKDNLLDFKLDTPFILAYQEEAVWDDNHNVKIHFNKLISDSRCPIDAECVWAGRVELEITFTQDGSSQTAVVALGDTTGTNYSDTATFGNFTVKLLEVKPLPKSYMIIPPEAYTIKLEIKKGP